MRRHWVVAKKILALTTAPFGHGSQCVTSRDQRERLVEQSRKFPELRISWSEQVGGASSPGLYDRERQSGDGLHGRMRTKPLAERDSVVIMPPWMPTSK